jgi:hypothetical protein
MLRPWATDISSPIIREEGTRHSGRVVGKNEAACAADASREVGERWLPKG